MLKKIEGERVIEGNGETAKRGNGEYLRKCEAERVRSWEVGKLGCRMMVGVERRSRFSRIFVHRLEQLSRR